MYLPTITKGSKGAVRSLSKGKIFNDPVYGFVSVPYGILFDLIETPYFQRLRRIHQVGLTYYVYPGALHTRFHHALGAFHLMTQAVHVLRSKGAEITDEEAEAVFVAILLHDIGHGPFSHALEGTLIQIPHEQISLLFMDVLNQQMNGRLDLAIEIFENKHSKTFLHQLVSGQLDMDRMDYLNRDSFYTGVSEGVIGYDRIIKMLAVHNGELVVEEKGIYSIEKFLVARRIMYWQVYLHKTALAAELMLIHVIKRGRELLRAGHDFALSKALAFFLRKDVHLHTLGKKEDLVALFAQLDDTDIWHALKQFQFSPDPVIRFLAISLLNRSLFRVEMSYTPFPDERIQEMQEKVQKHYGLKAMDVDFLVYHGAASNVAYSTNKEEIKIRYKSGEIKAVSQIAEHGISSKIITKYYLCYPKNIT